MTDLSRCCGRTMSSVRMDRDGVRLHSCQSCGQHAWTRNGEPVGRAELLEALRDAPARRQPTRRRAAAAPPPDLRELLKGFRPHGTSS